MVGARGRWQTEFPDRLQQRKTKRGQAGNYRCSSEAEDAGTQGVGNARSGRMRANEMCIKSWTWHAEVPKQEFMREDCCQLRRFRIRRPERDPPHRSGDLGGLSRHGDVRPRRGKVAARGRRRWMTAENDNSDYAAIEIRLRPSGPLRVLLKRRSLDIWWGTERAFG